MFFKILKRTFWGWWDNISFSFLTSIMGATNPFFIVLLSTFRWIVAEDFEIVIKYQNLFFVLIIVCLLSIAVFPTTIAAYAIQRRLLKGDTEKFFLYYWKGLKKYFGRGMLLTLINTIIGGLLAYSIVYYNTALSSWYPFNYILIGISGLFILLFLLSQIVMIPLVITDDYKISEYYLISFHMTLKNGLRIALVAIVNFIMVVIFFIPIISPFLIIVPIVAYYGFASTLHLWTFSYVDGSVSVEDVLPKRKFKELFTPFANMFVSKSKRKKRK